MTKPLSKVQALFLAGAGGGFGRKANFDNPTCRVLRERGLIRIDGAAGRTFRWTTTAAGDAELKRLREETNR